MVQLARIWEDKIARDHPELREHVEEVLATVAATTADACSKLTTTSSQLLGPTAAGADQYGRGDTQGSKAMEALNVKIGPLVFDHADYDAEGDVLYLHVGAPQEGDGEETPEGHVLRFEPGTHRIVGLTVMNVRWLLDRDGRLTIAIPETVEASAAELAPALAAA